MPVRCLVALLLLAATARAEAFRPLAPGVELATFRLPVAASLGDSTLTVVRVDPRRRRLVLVGRGTGEARRTARRWADRHHLLAVINAGMFGPDDRTVSFARSPAAVFNGRHSKEHAELVFDPTSNALAPLRLLDDACDDRAKLEPSYASALQSIRLLDCHGHVRWSASPKRWSVAALALDRSGRLLLLHCRSPYPMRAFATMLAGLPLDLAGAMYLEGGPEATLFVRAGGVTRELVGSYETGFNENDDNHEAWALPNVLGVE